MTPILDHVFALLIGPILLRLQYVLHATLLITGMLTTRLVKAALNIITGIVAQINVFAAQLDIHSIQLLLSALEVQLKSLLLPQSPALRMLLSLTESNVPNALTISLSGMVINVLPALHKHISTSILKHALFALKD